MVVVVAICQFTNRNIKLNKYNVFKVRVKLTEDTHRKKRISNVFMFSHIFQSPSLLCELNKKYRVVYSTVL